MKFANLVLIGAVAAHALDETYDRNANISWDDHQVSHNVTVSWRDAKIREQFRLKEQTDRQWLRDNNRQLRAIDRQAQALARQFQKDAQRFSVQQLRRDVREFKAIEKVLPYLESGRITPEQRNTTEWRNFESETQHFVNATHQGLERLAEKVERQA